MTQHEAGDIVRSIVIRSTSFFPDARGVREAPQRTT
jgi:hypothetical protein